MAANVYEGMFILDSNRFGRDHEAVSAQIPAMIEKLGGEMLVSRLWEERRLAYPINGQRKGTYWLTYFRLDSLQLAELRHQCQINDSILRVLFLKVDPRIVDALVEHARSAPVVTSTVSDDVVDEDDSEDDAVAVADEVGVDAVGLDDEDL